MPTRCIHSRSFLMPSLVMLPFIQCHHTRGFASFGGLIKFLYRLSLLACCAFPATKKKINVKNAPVLCTKLKLKLTGATQSYSQISCRSKRCNSSKNFFSNQYIQPQMHEFSTITHSNQLIRAFVIKN